MQPVGGIAQPSSAGEVPWTPSLESGLEEKALAEDLGCFRGSLHAEVGGVVAILPIQSNWRYCRR
jgi:hypothetical protein